MSKISGNWSKVAVGGLAVAMLGLLGPVAAQTAVPAVREALERPGPAGKAAAVADYGKLPLRFEANVGQVDPEAKFLARAKGGTVFLTGDEAVLSIGSKGQSADGTMGPAAPTGAVVRMRALGADPKAEPEGVDVLPGVTNYLTGSDPAGWRTGVTSFGGVRYRGVYPGIDQVFHGKNSALEYDFEVAPGADPNRIALSFDGATSITLDPTTGDLVMTTVGGEVRQAKPTLYQDIDGARRPVAGGFAIDGPRVSFTVGAYDQHLPLVIDPVIAYSALLGGTGNEVVGGVAVDSTGAAYIAGHTTSVDFPTLNALQPARATGFSPFDMFITKLTPDGSALAYSTYLGGTGLERAAGISVDATGAAYVAGLTTSPNFPMAGNSFDSVCGATGTCLGQEAVMAKLTPAGSALTYATYLGGSANDAAAGISADAQGNAYVSGTTRSPNFPTTDGTVPETTEAYDRFCGTSVDGSTGLPDGTCNGGSLDDVFLARINTNATTGPASLAYSTYLGGGGSDTAAGVAADKNESQGGVYIVGSSAGLGFPTTPTAFQPGCDRQLDPQAPCSTLGRNAFVVKLLTGQSGAASLTGPGGFGTYLGSPGSTNARAVAADFFGVYVTGETTAVGYPTKNAFQPQLNQTPSAPQSQDAFVSKLVSDGTNLVYSTFLGGTGGDFAQGIAVDAAGAAFVTGGTSSSNFPTKDSIQGPAGGFVAKLAPSGSTVDYSTYLSVFGKVAVNPVGDSAVYVAGTVRSADFPAVTGSLRVGMGGGDDAGLVKLVPGVTPVVNQLTPRGGPTSGGTPVVITGESFTGATGVKFGGVPAVSFTVDSATQITAIAPSRAEGSIADLTVFVTVTGAQGTSLALGSARYVYGEGVFHPTGSCVENRCPTGGQAVNLLDGRVLYTNGAGARFVNDTLPASSQIYNPASATWSVTGACAGCGFGEFGRTFTITTLPSGKVLVAGGLSLPIGEPTAAAFLYDPATGTWSPTGSMTTVRHGHTATLLANGKVLVAGGCAINDCSTAELPPLATSELYDPATGLWTRTPGDMTAGRSEHTATLMDPAGGPCGSVCGKVLVAFGSGASIGDILKPGLASAELFDPATGTWAATASSSGSGRTRHSAVRLLDGRVMISGGYDSDAPFPPETNATELYNPVTETWSIRGILTTGHGLQPSLVRLPNGKVLIVGGRTDIAEIWDPADGRWRSATSSAFLPRLNPAAVLLVSGPASTCGTNCGKVLVAGGARDLNIGTSNPPLAAAEMYTSKPALTVVAPVSGTVGSSVTITGTGLASSTSVSFGSVATTAVTHDPVNPDGVLTVAVPIGASGAVDVTVSSLGGVSAVVPAGRFTVTTPPAPPPTVGSISPSGGAAGSSVTITGSGLGSVTSVSFGSVSTTSFTVNPDGSLTVVVPNGVSGVVNVTVTSPSGTSAVVPAGSFTVRPLFSTFVPVSPARILDTRFGNGAPTARVGAGGVVDLQVTGRGGVPASGVTAVALNVTAVAPTAGSFVTAWPTGEARPLASNVNLDTGAIVPNLAVVKVGTGGRVSVFNALGDVDLLADVAGYYLDPAAGVPGSSFAAVSPARILDTRFGNGAPMARIGAGGVVDVQVTGRGGVPASGVTAVAVNVTAVTPSATSFVTAWPFGEARPLASNLNSEAGVTRPNMVIVKVGAGGKFSLYNDAGSVDLLADVAGYYLDPAAVAASTFTAVSPSRILDTRFGNGAPTARVGPGQTIDLQVTGAGGVPATGVTSVVMNLTSVSPTAAGWVTAWPAGEAKPLASNLNLTPGVTVANLVVVKVGAGGKVSLYNEAGTTDLIADVAGYNAT